MKLSIKIIVGAAIVAASVAAATFGASAPAAASEILRASAADAGDISARKKRTKVRVTKLSKRAAEPPNPNRPYYRPVPHFYPFAQDRGYF
jgi:hypothetical protein